MVQLARIRVGFDGVDGKLAGSLVALGNFPIPWAHSSSSAGRVRLCTDSVGGGPREQRPHERTLIAQHAAALIANLVGGDEVWVDAKAGSVGLVICE